MNDAENRDARIRNRPRWSNHIVFQLVAIGKVVGLGNIWRFPHMVLMNGGGAFLIPYLISMVMVTIPLVIVNIYLNQFSSQGILTCWELSPMFKGVGYSILIMDATFLGPYSNIITLAYVYLFASIAYKPVWLTCDNVWNTCACHINTTGNWRNTHPDCKSTALNEKDMKRPTEEYFYNNVLRKSSGIEHMGSVDPFLALCNFINWLVICTCIIRGVTTLGKVAYVFTISVFVIFVILLFRGMTLEGAFDGISYYLSPNLHRLTYSTVWIDAVRQSMFSMSTTSLSGIASYNQFTYNLLYDALAIAMVDTAVSFCAGFVIFSTLGHLAHTKKTTVTEVTAGGFALVFVVFPEVLGTLPGYQFWSALFFILVICLGTSSMIFSVEMIIVSIQDEYPELGNENDFKFRVAICIVYSVVSLTFTMNGGHHVMELLYSLNLPYFLFGLIQFLIVSMVYGVDRFADDILLMVGNSILNYRLCYWYLQWMLHIFGPLLIVYILLNQVVKYRPLTDRGFPLWADICSWFLMIGMLIWIPGYYIYRYYRMAGTLRMTWNMTVKLNMPTKMWRPGQEEHRKGRYGGSKEEIRGTMEEMEPLEEEVNQLMELTDLKHLPVEQTVISESPLGLAVRESQV